MPLRLLKLAGTFLATVWVSTMLVFLLLRVMPGDPATVALGTDATAEQLDAWRAQYGTTAPLWEQYLQWIGGIVRGDFGTSYVTQAAIGPTLVERAQVTLLLVALAMVVALVVAVPLGTFSAMRHGKASGGAVSAFSQIGVALPSFLVGMLLIAVFAIQLRWLPSGGWRWGPDVFRYAILPVLALGSVQASILTRYVRSAVLEIKGEDFLRTARSKGLTANAALIRHGLKNASVPVLTVVGVQLAGLLVGAVVVERVFAIPGLGSYLVDAVANRDLLAVQSIVLLLVLAVVVINFVVDVAYTSIDPRLRRA
ncbi:ABC transporter permease [Microbacterium sp. SORGH_AS_0421]|uniref:ABC transporter permease n=1 Tax=Microbacterium sp. SORGH_AS_0421 TaxID=3041768 RepID=UPI00278D5E79|nr:ABC transporter permease [Microbacterium sp. SORGH_AS_0421]MDQ1176225.1 peptide/nickel transport system permease protein [Microbacterium sp. SORGH_AS_0421]